MNYIIEHPHVKDYLRIIIFDSVICAITLIKFLLSYAVDKVK